MQSSLATVLSDLDALKGERAFKQKFETVFSSFGYSRYTYVGLDTTELDDDKPANAVYLTNFRSDWVARYVKEDYAAVDPIIKDCATSRLPIRWSEKYRANSRTQDETRMMEDAWENGLKHGLTIPIHGPGGELGIFTLNADMNEHEFRETSERAKYELQTIAFYFHDAVQRSFRVEQEVPLPVPLTGREVEILRWTVAGKTAWEIGAILKISERTVNFHIQNVMEKFGVHNKTHAAAKAMGLGFLNI